MEPQKEVDQPLADLYKDLLKQITEERQQRVEQEKVIGELQRALGRKECVEAARNLVPNAMVPPANQHAEPPPQRRQAPN